MVFLLIVPVFLLRGLHECRRDHRLPLRFAFPVGRLGGRRTYHWVLHYLHSFGGKTHLRRLGTQEVERFLAHLAIEGQVSTSTPRQALNALVFLSQDVLH